MEYAQLTGVVHLLKRIFIRVSKDVEGDAYPHQPPSPPAGCTLRFDSSVRMKDEIVRRPIAVLSTLMNSVH